jgi:hypothetical protein
MKNQKKVNQQSVDLNKFEAHKLNLTESLKGGNAEAESLSYTVTSTGYTAGDDWDFHSES